MSQLDLLLVNAPSQRDVYRSLSSLAAVEPPVWAGLIARHCLNKGFSVQILDAEAEGMTPAQAATEIEFRSPCLTVFCVYGHQPSASTQCMSGASAVARLLQGQIPTLALGTHPSALPERTLREESFDYVCQGEGPRTIIEWLRRYKVLEEEGCVSFGSIDGIWFRANSDNRPLGNPPAQNIIDLNAELPDQAWELLDMKKYRAHNWHLWTGDPTGGYASVQTSLGCVFSCHFCCIQAPFGKPGMRWWSPDNIVEQIERLVLDYGITNIKIPDEMFVLNPQHVKSICEGLITWGLGDQLNMWAYARVDTVKDEEMLALMRRAGFRWLGIGVESGSQHVRDGVAKGRFGEDDIFDAIRRVQSHGIHVGANYIFGLPDDTHKSMQTTLTLAEQLNTEWANFYCAMAYPGSPLHRIAQKKGWRLPEDPGGHGWIGYAQHAYEALPLPTETLTYQEVLDFRDDAHLRYFSRPEYLSMIDSKFRHTARRDVEQMLALGKPKRKHRDLPDLDIITP